MVANAGQGPILLMKKLSGMFSLVLGGVLTAYGYSVESTGTVIVGVALLALGAILLALKIIRRNRGGQPG